MSSGVYLFFTPRGHEPPPTLRDRINPHLRLLHHRFPISRYAKRPDVALYATGPLFLLLTPSSLHCTFKFPNEIRFGSLPSPMLMSVPSQKVFSCAMTHQYRYRDLMSAIKYEGHGRRKNGTTLNHTLGQKDQIKNNKLLLLPSISRLSVHCMTKQTLFIANYPHRIIMNFALTHVLYNKSDSVYYIIAHIHHFINFSLTQSTRRLGSPWVGPINAALKRLKLATVTPGATSTLSACSASLFFCRCSGALSFSFTHAANVVCVCDCMLSCSVVFFRPSVPFLTANITYCSARYVLRTPLPNELSLSTPRAAN